MKRRYAEMFASEDDRRVLEAIRQQQGLETLDDAAEVALRSAVLTTSSGSVIPASNIFLTARSRASKPRSRSSLWRSVAAIVRPGAPALSAI
mgnify:CR=1 FL=1